MLVSILIGTGIGIALGTVSGLIPGIHANTMAGLLLSLQAVLLLFLDPVALAAAMFAALVTHTFLDIIPSTFLGIPDADTALAVLPAHALCLEGRGEEAVRISALGSAAGVVLALPIAVFCFVVLPAAQPLIDWGIGLLILAVAGFLIVISESPAWAAAVFGVSGLLGLFTFRFSYLAWHTVGDSAVLMPLLAGLFGISVLLTASRGIMPLQQFRGLDTADLEVGKGSVLGAVAGAMVGWMPGLSNATANALLTTLVGYDSRPREYILATGAANTVNAFLGLAALYALSRTRNGVMVALSAGDLPPPTALLLAGVLAGFCCLPADHSACVVRHTARQRQHHRPQLRRHRLCGPACAPPRRPLRRTGASPGDGGRPCAPDGQREKSLLHGGDHAPGHALLVRHRRPMISDGHEE